MFHPTHRRAHGGGHMAWVTLGGGRVCYRPRPRARARAWESLLDAFWVVGGWGTGVVRRARSDVRVFVIICSQSPLANPTPHHSPPALKTAEVPAQAPTDLPQAPSRRQARYTVRARAALVFRSTGRVSKNTGLYFTWSRSERAPHQRAPSVLPAGREHAPGTPAPSGVLRATTDNRARPSLYIWTGQIPAGSLLGHRPGAQTLPPASISLATMRSECYC